MGNNFDTAPLLDFVMILWIQWNSYKKNSNEYFQSKLGIPGSYCAERLLF